MISPSAIEQVSPVSSKPNLADALFVVGSEGAKISRILDFAEYLGIQDFGPVGKLELWVLRKAIAGHPKGSTVARETLEKALFPASAAKYGAGQVETASADFKAVETPGNPTA